MVNNDDEKIMTLKRMIRSAEMEIKRAEMSLRNGREWLEKLQRILQEREQPAPETDVRLSARASRRLSI